MRIGRQPLSINPPARAGFTLIELLVVLGVILILASLLLPALSRARSTAVSSVCLGNTRQLNLAWGLYAVDADDRLPLNLQLDPLHPLPAAALNMNWVNNIMTWELDPDNTNTSFVAVSP